jgi:hypothetical protein
MKEKDFIREFLEAVQLQPKGLKVEKEKSLLYDVTIDQDGCANFNLDSSGFAIRGGGRAFEQDILIYETAKKTGDHVVPRVSIEVKYPTITTHDILTYSEKARRIKSIYPYLRYGLLIGGLNSLPPRACRLGRDFDFMVACPCPLESDLMAAIKKLLLQEIKNSISLGSVFREKNCKRIFQRSLRLE